MLNDARAFARYAKGLRAFLRDPLPEDECQRRVAAQLRTREESFLQLLELGVFGRKSSPYGILLRAAGIEYGDIVHLVREHGVEGALERLHDAHVYITLDEFRGRRPISRPGVELAVSIKDFANPLIAPVYATATGGSRSAGRRVMVDFDYLEHEAPYHSLFLAAFGLQNRPYGMWRPAPPGGAGLLNALRCLKVGLPVERWFSQSRLDARRFPKETVLTRYTVFGSRRWSHPLPMPEYAPLSEPERVAQWLAEKSQQDTPAVFNSPASAAVRVCLAAQDEGLEISGTQFRLGGEPFTTGKHASITQTGSRAVANYASAEVGQIGVACAQAATLDEVHLLTDKVGVIQREREVGTSGIRVGALLFTSLHPSSAKILLNVESDDYGTLERRACGCLLDEIGLQQHLHTIRSYEKLTSEGMTFLGSDLLVLLEETLPALFGGTATDYQFVEEEKDGVPRVEIVVSPRVGEVDEGRLVATVLERLEVGPSYKRMMASVWRDGGTLRVIRREPYATGAAKILPLHVLQDSGSER